MSRTGTSSAGGMPHLWHLKGFDLFRGVNDEQLEPLERASHLQRLRRGETLYLPGDAADRVFALREGLIKLVARSDEGREATLALLQAGEVFGELEVIEGTTREHVAIASEPSLVFALPRDLFLTLMQRHKDFAFSVSVRLGQRVQQFHSKIACLLFKGAHSRLSELLVELATRYGQPTPEGTKLRYRFSHRELASLIGVARETVSYTLGELRRSGTVSTRSGYIVLHKLDRLRV